MFLIVLLCATFMCIICIINFYLLNLVNTCLLVSKNVQVILSYNTTPHYLEIARNIHLGTVGILLISKGFHFQFRRSISYMIKYFYI